MLEVVEQLTYQQHGTVYYIIQTLPNVVETPNFSFDTLYC